MQTAVWVDFKLVKQSVSMEQVLARYGLLENLKRSGDELRGVCPIHEGEGQDAFHASTTKQAFQCFSCKARGNVLDFVSAMEQCSVRDAAVMLQEWFGVEGASGKQQRPPARVKNQQRRKQPLQEVSRGEDTTATNQPMSFQLQGVDCSHSYLAQRGIERSLAEEFGIGFFPGRGCMSERVVIPIHNSSGELVAYAGRSIDGSEPKYKLPAGFHKEAEVFNLHRVAGRTDQVVVVEGFFDCLKLYQPGFPAVALMGSSLSLQQEQLLCQHFKSAVFMFDGDSAGRRCSHDCLVRLGQQMWVRAVMLEEGQQPDELSVEELSGLLKK